MTEDKVTNNVKGVARSDEPAENDHLNSQLPSASPNMNVRSRPASKYMLKKSPFLCTRISKLLIIGYSPPQILFHMLRIPWLQAHWLELIHFEQSGITDTSRLRTSSSKIRPNVICCLPVLFPSEMCHDTEARDSSNADPTRLKS